MSGFDQYGGYGPESGAPGGPPSGMGSPAGMPQQGTMMTEDRSGCSSCLVGCAVAVVVALVLFVGLAWYGYVWVKDNVLVEKEPLPIEAPVISDEQISSLVPVLKEMGAHTGKKIDLVLSGPEACYLFLAIAYNSKSSSGEQWAVPSLADIDEMGLKIFVDFPEDGVINYSVSVPYENTAGYFNLESNMEIEISEGKAFVKLRRLSIGKLSFSGKEASIISNVMNQQFESDPDIQEMLQRVPKLKIERGRARVRLVIMPHQSQ